MTEEADISQNSECYNCGALFNDIYASYEFCDNVYCWDCLREHVYDECIEDAVDLWIEKNCKIIK